MTLLLAGFGESLPAQTLIDFESFGLDVGTFRNQVPAGANAFRAGDLGLPNSYDTSTDAWRGWAISATTDATKPGFRNQYSSTTGGGAGGSQTYALAFADGRIETGGRAVNSMKLTNSTYAAQSMLRGDAFAKRFGGVTGRDADFFRVVFRGWRGGSVLADTLLVYLADYRAATASADYVLQTWREVDFQRFGAVDSLTYVFESSDVGAFGINTPTYFCIDDVVLAELVSVGETLAKAGALIAYPNPVAEALSLKLEGGVAPFGRTYALYDGLGRCVSQGIYAGPVDVSALGTGVYVVVIDRVGAARFWRR